MGVAKRYKKNDTYFMSFSSNHYRDDRDNPNPNDDYPVRPRTPAEQEKWDEWLTSVTRKERFYEKEPKSYFGQVVYGALGSCLAAGVIIILLFI